MPKRKSLESNEGEWPFESLKLIQFAGERDQYWLVRWNAWLHSAGIADCDLLGTMEEAEDFFPDLELPKDRLARLSLIDRRIRSYARRRRIRLRDRAAAAASATGAAAPVIPATTTANAPSSSPAPPPLSVTPINLPAPEWFSSGHSRGKGTWTDRPLALSRIARCLTPDRRMDWRQAKQMLAETGLIQVSRQGWIVRLDPLSGSIQERIRRAERER